MHEDDDKTALELVQSLMDLIESDIDYIKTWGSDYDRRMEALLSGAAPQHVDMNKPIKIDEAIFMPELGGYLAVNPEHSIPSQTHAVKTIRNAIASGALAVERPNAKNQLLTRNFLQEWRETCRERPNLPDSYSENPAQTKTVKLPTKLNTASMIEAKELTRASAKETLNKLKKP